MTSWENPGQGTADPGQSTQSSADRKQLEIVAELVRPKRREVVDQVVLERDRGLGQDVAASVGERDRTLEPRSLEEGCAQLRPCRQHHARYDGDTEPGLDEAEHGIHLAALDGQRGFE